jgi:hypothetical protein
LSDSYLVLLSGALLGYATLGKGFAYFGIPPIFVGEIVFLTGLIVFFRTGCLVATLSTTPSLILVVTMVWVALRTLPFVGLFGFDALRDSAVIMYGGFAFIIVALLLEDGRRVNSILRYYNIFLGVYVPIIPFLFIFSRYMEGYIPKWPGSSTPLLELRPGDVAVHLAGAAVFALVGFRKVTSLWIAFVFATLALASVSSRGAMLAAALPVMFAVLVVGKIRELAIVLAAGLAIFYAAYSVESAFSDYREAQSSAERSLSAHQIVDNVASIFGRSGEQTEDTKQWREDWWDLIVKDTIYGPNFWTGRGFGLNLAESDGVAGADDPDHPPLRSPHNVQMTMLARTGVPGAALWGIFVVSWLGMLTIATLTARRRGQREWAGLFLFIGCYATSIIINATFDVALEGPMQGIWFWCLIGLGTGSVMIYRLQPHERI